MRKSLQRTLLLLGLLAAAALSLLLAMRAAPAGGWTLAIGNEEDTPAWITLFGQAVHLPLLLFCLCLGWGIVWLGWELTRSQVRLHRVALALLLSGGLMLAMTKPALTITGYDEELHRLYVAAFSGQEAFDTADWLSAFNTWYFGYVPYAAGMRLGLSLGVGEGWALRLALMAGAAVYAALAALAVRHAPRMKLTFLAVAALPSCLMISANVSYDSTVIGCCLLGTALVLEELSCPDRLLSPNRAVTMTALLSLGTLPKPAYSLALLLLLLLPRSKFATRRRWGIFRLFVVAVLLLCLASMLLGMYDEILPGDERMDNTDSAAQLRYIVTQPGAFLTMLGRYLATEFPLLFAFAGMTWNILGEYHTLSVALLAALAFLCPLCTLEEQGPSPLTRSRRLTMAALSLLPLLGLVLTQYMVSSAVGMDTVDGMQPRYVLPVLVPLLLAVSPPDAFRQRCRPWGRAVAAAAVLLLMAATFLPAREIILGSIWGLL